MKKTIFYAAILLALLFAGCKPTSVNENTEEPKQLNISILLDLSDRISPSVHPASPTHQERDLAIINGIVEFFKKDMEDRGAFDANGRIQVFMEPAPAIPNIDQLQSHLIVDCSKMDVKQKKEIYDNITTDFSETLQEIYMQTIAGNKFPGSDIWRFFQNKAKDYCIARDTIYRNVLVILTDGYIYDPTTAQKAGNRVQSLIGKTIGKYRQSADPIAAMQSDDFGLIVPQGICLDNLEVLVLEVAPEKNSQKDEQILGYCLDKWLKEMGVSHHAVYMTDLPANTSRRIEQFFDI